MENKILWRRQLYKRSEKQALDLQKKMNTMESYKYHFMDKDFNLGVLFDHYISTGYLYVGLINLDNEDDPYFMDLTINVSTLLPFYATIDDSLDKGLCDWLIDIGAGRTCNRKIQSNFSEYPLFEFDPEFMKEGLNEKLNSTFSLKNAL